MPAAYRGPRFGVKAQKTLVIPVSHLYETALIRAQNHPELVGPVAFR
jgi:uncharacterized membrane protein